MTRMEWRLEPSDCVISSRAGLKRTWPKVSHLLTVIDPMRRLTWEMGELLSSEIRRMELEVLAELLWELRDASWI